MNSLHHLYYYKSYCHYLLGQQEEYEIATRKCLAAIIVLDDPGQLERSMALMEKDSGKSPWDLLHITSMEQLYFKKDLQKE